MIDANLTPSDYDLISRAFPKHNPQFSDQHGWNTVCLASLYGNGQLVKHLIESSKGLQLVNLGAINGLPPLSCACLSDNHSGALAAAEVLCDQGAEVNMMTSSESSILWKVNGVYQRVMIPKQATPLWMSKEIAYNTKLCQFLMGKGAILSPNSLTQDCAEPA